MFRTHSQIQSVSGSGQGSVESPISELNPAAQLHLLKTLIQVKQSCDTKIHHDSHLEMSALTEELFWSTSSSDPRSCLLEALGTFLVQVMGVLSQLSVSLTNGPHIADYVENYIRSVCEDDDFADMTVISFLERKLSLLGQISIELSDLSNTCEKSWSAKAPRQPNWRLPAHPFASRPPFMSNQQPTPGNNYLNDMPDSYYTNNNPSQSLQARGKGKHVCSYGFHCDRGGVGDDGQVVVFERNSAFRTHMAKHQKSFKCNLPGCPNTTGFARPDQLERHMKNVRHGDGG